MKALGVVVFLLVIAVAAVLLAYHLKSGSSQRRRNKRAQQRRSAEMARAVWEAHTETDAHQAVVSVRKVTHVEGVMTVLDSREIGKVNVDTPYFQDHVLELQGHALVRASALNALKVP